MEDANTSALYFSKRLLDGLAVILERPLTIVEAPVGYGKTTAVREFLNKRDIRRLWVPVPGHLNFATFGGTFDGTFGLNGESASWSGVSEDAFWRTFCRELGRGLPEASEIAASLERLGYPRDPALFETARELLRQLRLAAPTVLVIDDFHLLPSPAFGLLCEVLAKEAPAGTGIINLHITLVSRHVYPGAKELLRLKGVLGVVGQETFTFSAEDIQNYYALHRLDITPEEAHALAASSGGWISGLYIQLLRHRKQGAASMPVFGAISSEDSLPPAQAALLEKEIYAPLPPEIQNLLFSLCPLERFTVLQADFLYGKDTRALLRELTRQNSFVALDRSSGVYSMHAIFRRLLARLFQDLPLARQKEIHRRCADWFAQEGEFLSAMEMYRLARDFEKALTVMEQDMSRNLVTENAAFFASMFRECPEDIMDRHPGAAFKRALAALAASDFPAFGKGCARLAAQCAAMPENDPQTRVWRGELEVLLALTAYNDIAAMSIHHRKAWELLGRPTGLYPTQSTWTMGCPSALFMFHRKSGALARELRLMQESMPLYYRLTSGHGAGGDYLFEAEALYHAGAFSAASVACYKAEAMAEEHRQTGNLICALFLRLRLAAAAGDLPGAQERLKAMRGAITKSRDYFLLHTVELCTGWLYAILGQENNIPRWIGATAEAARDNRMYAFARGSWFLVHGRALLLAGQYEKVTGLFGRLLESGLYDRHNVFFIYSHIYLAAARQALGGKAPAVKSLRTALDAALPDNLLMPFVENNRHIQPLLRSLQRDRRREGVRRILDLAENWNTGLQGMDAALPQYRLTPQQLELVRLAAAGKNFKEIAVLTGCAHGTVKNKFTSLYKRFGVHGSKELLAKAAQAGLAATPERAQGRET